MKPTLLLLLTATLLAFAGCSSTPTNVNTGTIHARTFNFVVRTNKAAPSGVDATSQAHRMIQDAITKNLAARGIQRVAANGDVTVPYLIITGNNVSTTAINDYFGYSEDLSALHEKAHEKYTGTKNPNDFEAGTLLIDIVDGKTHKLLKRGYATRQILRGTAANVRAARIQKVVDQILKDVKFAN